MKNRVTLFMMVAVLAAMVLSGCGVLQEPAEVSAPLEAIPVEIEEVAPTAIATAEEVEPVLETEEEMSEPEPAEEIEPEAEEAAVEEPVVEEPAEAVATGPIIYAIDPSSSEVSFVLDEDLRGVRTTVVGVTNQIAAELALDLNDLSTARLGTLLVNARGFATDNNFRNRAIQNEIFESAIYEFITFEPTSIDGLPDSASPGDTVQFTIAGDLTIRDVTLPVTFDVEAQVNSSDQISGTASTIVNRNDFQLTVPAVPNVANVEEDVELYIRFVANATS